MHDRGRNSRPVLVWHCNRWKQVAEQHVQKRLVASDRCWPLVSLFLVLMAITHSTTALHTMLPRSVPQTQFLTSRAVENASLLECLQVAPPILSPIGGCHQTLMVHTFAFSYGQPFVGDYYPPDCDFNHVAFDLTVTSAGRQFDRLALMYFGDIEVFRTSTAEPTQNGIIWSYSKDMSAYLTLFKRPQKIIFDLGNLVDDTYTGIWNATLTATFFTANNTIKHADIIIPVSARRSAANQSSAFIVPESKAMTNLKIPQNAERAVFSISACGQAAEEFWWSNVFTSDTKVFGNETTLYGHSPFRELQLFIDGKLAGVAWPFPVIFTGGIVPGFWRPVVGIDAFDLREDEIDISPFIPLLNDNNEHIFEIRVVGIDDDGKGNGMFTERIESNWVVTGKLFVWLDTSTSMTTGTMPAIHAPEPSLQLYSTTHQTVNGTMDTLEYSIRVERHIHIKSLISTSLGLKALSWKQNLSFSNSGTLNNKGNNQVMQQTTSGTCISSAGYTRSFDYPLWVISSYNAVPGGNLTIDAKMGRGKYIQQLGGLAFSDDWRTFDINKSPSMPYGLSFRGTYTKNWQSGTASYLSVPAQKKSYGWGSTEQLFAMSGTNHMPVTVVQDGTNEAGMPMGGQRNEELYWRHIIATNDSIVYDDERIGGEGTGRAIATRPKQGGHENEMHEFASEEVRGLLGRGPA
ncbi:peptide N-acetyl-beta-D-glucosaminyl asparaginase amidase A-domain-containing protein [Phaeosphaeriaceae sp. PMI808]|nr:peptide N-acetyl-beta-D-glucosaminyl asparaginase amidase A-domain-containing protein [Phaeosphaeriaceae sp. PMI808]